MFSNFEGGIIDAASLGFLQIDREGNVNPSMLPNRIFGPGGFPVIAGGAPRIYFAGAFTAGGSRIAVANGKLQIIREGSVQKFVEKVYRVVFSGRQAVKYRHEILYITERAVFALTEKGITLEEVAPGVDIERDIMPMMGFEPLMSPHMKEMDSRLFGEGKMGLKEEMIRAINS